VPAAEQDEMVAAALRPTGCYDSARIDDVRVDLPDSSVPAHRADLTVNLLHLEGIVMPRRSTTAPLVSLIALGTLAACTATPAGTTGRPSPAISLPAVSPPADTAAPEPSPAETEPAETPGAGTPAAPTGAVPTVPAETGAATFGPDVSLEEMFPDDVAGQSLDVTSTTGEGILGLLPDLDPARIGAFMARYGKTIQDASAAFTFSFVPGATAGDIGVISIAGLRVAGVPADDLVTGFTEIVTADTPGAEVTQTTISGKEVTVVADPTESPDQAVTLYGVSDVVFVVGGTPDHVEETLGKLP
jgi:hypothetical protein